MNSEKQEPYNSPDLKNSSTSAQDGKSHDPQHLYEVYKEMKAKAMSGEEQEITVESMQDDTEMTTELLKQNKTLQNEKEQIVNDYSEKLSHKDLEIDKLKNEIYVLRKRLEEQNTRHLSLSPGSPNRNGSPRTDIFLSNSSTVLVPPYFNRRVNHSQTLRWQKGKELGQGAYGRVLLGITLDSAEFIAVKQVDTSRKDSDENSQDRFELAKLFEKEIMLMKQLNHQHIVKYIGTEWYGNQFSIFLEYVPGGTISSMVQNFGKLSEQVIQIYTKQILLGLEYLHDNNIVHRDIKGANILVDGSGVVKLADFGCSKQLAEAFTPRSSKGDESIRGTPYYMAPEVVMGKGHRRESDIWSVGCVMVEMSTGHPPWYKIKDHHTLLYHLAMTDDIPSIPSHLSPAGKAFLERCFRRDPNERPSASSLLEDPFIKDIDTNRVFDIMVPFDELEFLDSQGQKLRRKSVESAAEEEFSISADSTSSTEAPLSFRSSSTSERRLSARSSSHSILREIPRSTMCVAIEILRIVRTPSKTADEYYEKYQEQREKLVQKQQKQERFDEDSVKKEASPIEQ